MRPPWSRQQPGELTGGRGGSRMRSSGGGGCGGRTPHVQAAPRHYALHQQRQWWPLHPAAANRLPEAGAAPGQQQQQQQQQQRHQGGRLPRADRAELLRLMASRFCQQSKLGGAFTREQQLRSQMFWRLAAAYLRQPLTAVMQAGMRLRTEADRLEQEAVQRLRSRRQQAASAAAVLPPSPTAAASLLPATNATLQAARNEEAPPAAAKRKTKHGERRPTVETGAAAAEPQAATDQPVPSGAKQHKKKKKKKKRRQLLQEGSQRDLAATGAHAADVQQPGNPAEQPGQPASKKARRHKEPRSSAVPALPAVAEEPEAGALAEAGALPPATTAQAEAAMEPRPAAEQPVLSGSKQHKKKKHKKKEHLQKQHESGQRELAAAGAQIAVGQKPDSPAGKPEQPCEQPAKKKASTQRMLRPASVPALLAAGGEPAAAAQAPALSPAAATLGGAAAPVPAAAAPAEAAAPTSAAVAPPAKPPSSKKRWRAEAEDLLRLLATSAEHRQAVLGSPELDWEAIGAHMGRSGVAAQSHWAVMQRGGGPGPRTASQPGRPQVAPSPALAVAAEAAPSAWDLLLRQGPPASGMRAAPALAAVAAVAAPAAAAAAPAIAKPRSSRKGWLEQEQQLRLLATSAAHRQAVLGTTELDWEAIGRHLGRTSGAVRSHWSRMGKAACAPPQQHPAEEPSQPQQQQRQQQVVAAPRAGNPPTQQPSTSQPCGSASAAAADGAVLPVVASSPADHKRWEPEEVAELMRLAEDEQYRLQLLGSCERSWKLIGRHFGVSRQAANSKYHQERYTAAAGPVSKPARRMAGLFHGMVEMILRSMPDRTATSSQIFAALQQNPRLYAQLQPEHLQISTGQISTPRWHYNVRRALTRHAGIEQTGMKVGRKVQWRLLPEELWRGEKMKPRKKRSAATVTPLLGKNSRGPN